MTSEESVVRRIYGPLVRAQTYKYLLYFALSTVLGILYWVVLGIGITLGTVLAVAVVGLAVLVVTLYVARGITGLERWLANKLLGVSLKPYDDMGDISGGRLRGVVDAASTWRGLAFVFMKPIVSVLGIILLWAFSRALLMVTSILRAPHEISFGEVSNEEVESEPVVWSIEAGTEAALATVAGVVLVVVLLYVTSALGYGAAKKAEALVGNRADGEET